MTSAGPPVRVVADSSRVVSPTAYLFSASVWAFGSFLSRGCTVDAPSSSFVARHTRRKILAPFLSLLGLGYTRHKVDYFLRGFRSGGHPNSKEAKRLRKGEDFAVILLRGSRAAQAARKAALVAASGGSSGGVKVRVHIPCAPPASQLDWTFFHNVKCLPATSIADVKLNVRKALALVKTKTNDLGPDGAGPHFRIGRKVEKKSLPKKDGSTKKLEGTNVSRTVKACLYRYVENSTTPNLYVIRYD